MRVFLVLVTLVSCSPVEEDTDTGTCEELQGRRDRCGEAWEGEYVDAYDGRLEPLDTEASPAVEDVQEVARSVLISPQTLGTVFVIDQCLVMTVAHIGDAPSGAPLWADWDDGGQSGAPEASDLFLVDEQLEAGLSAGLDYAIYRLQPNGEDIGCTRPALTLDGDFWDDPPACPEPVMVLGHPWTGPDECQAEQMEHAGKQVSGGDTTVSASLWPAFGHGADTECGSSGGPVLHRDATTGEWAVIGMHYDGGCDGGPHNGALRLDALAEESQILADILADGTSGLCTTPCL